MPLSDVLSDEPLDPTPEPKQEEPKGEDSAPPAPKPDEAKPPETVPLAALKAERDKRQELERQFRELQQQFQQAQQPKKEEPDLASELFENPRKVLEQHHMAIKLETSEMLARSKYADFDDKASAFGELARQNPAIVQQMLASPNPGEFVYQTAKKHAEMQEIGDIDAYKAKLRAEIEAELKGKPNPAATLPPDLASAPSAGGMKTKPSWDGPTPMRDILARK